MNLKADIKNLEGLKREISVQVPAEIVNLKMDQMFNEIRKEKTLKGFRKGKAPLSAIKLNFGAQVKADVVDQVLKDSYREVLVDKKLMVASDPELINMQVNDDGGMNFVINLEVYPQIDKVKYDNLKLDKVENEVSDEEVDDYLSHLQEQFAERKKVDRPASDKDVVTVDLKKLLDSKLIMKETSFPNSLIDLTNSRTIKEFREHIPGMKTGESKEIEIKYADDYHDKQFAGAIIKYKATLKEVNEKILPKLDDSFAKKVGIAENFPELKLKLREEIGRQKDDHSKKEQKNLIIEQMVKNNQFPVPQASINDYLNNVVKDLQGKNPELKEDEIKKQYRPIGEAFFKWNFMYHKLSEQEKIEVLPADSEKLIKSFAANYKMTPQQATEALQKSGKIGEIRETILEEKVLDFLFSKTKFVKTKSK